MNLIITGIFLVFVFLIGLIPFPVLYLFSDLIRFILQRLVGYRKEVISSNLRGSFPDATEQEMQKMISDVYKNLADVTVEGLKAFSMTPKQVKRRHRIVNPELIESFLSQGKSIIAVPAHFNNWEWGSLSPGLFTHYPIYALYKPLSNKYIDRFAKWSRSKFGTSLASIYKTGALFEKNAGSPSIYIMAADQSPTNVRKSIWVNFMNRDTAFLHGPENYARRYDMPVLYGDVQRVKRGYYTLEISVIADNPKELPEGEITRRYAGKLEELIRKNPGSWLWSHRRWKLTR
ncbi:MAG: lysophospholipid acyltransferase family protein [Bacteroidales bacterium]|nr:lysophospholipid acyltransferase family protein [Bacteroidales bacterium]